MYPSNIYTLFQIKDKYIIIFSKIPYSPKFYFYLCSSPSHHFQGFFFLHESLLLYTITKFSPYKLIEDMHEPNYQKLFLDPQRNLILSISLSLKVETRTSLYLSLVYEPKSHPHFETLDRPCTLLTKISRK